MSNITYNIRLQTQSKEEHNLLLYTLIEHQKVWSHISHNLFQDKQIDKKFIHDSNYHQCRKLFPNAPSQVVIRAINSVYATYKTHKTNKILNQSYLGGKPLQLAVVDFDSFFKTARYSGETTMSSLPAK